MLSTLQTRANPPPSKYSWQFFSSAPGDPSSTKPDKVFEQSGYESEVGVGARRQWTRLPAMLSQGLESRLSYRVSSDQDYGRIVCRWGVLWLVRLDKYSVCFNDLNDLIGWNSIMSGRRMKPRESRNPAFSSWLLQYGERPSLLLVTKYLLTFTNLLLTIFCHQLECTLICYVLPFLPL